MIKPSDPRQLAIDILERSICSVKVGACVATNDGRILAWGWNSVGNGYGLHAEMHVLSRSNRGRLNEGAVIYVASERARNHKIITSKPCEECQSVIDKWELDVCWRDKDGRWVSE